MTDSKPATTGMRLPSLTRESRAVGHFMTFGEWLDQLDAAGVLAGNPYGAGSLSANTGIDCWWDYYEMGYEPADALLEDQSYGQ